MKHLTYMMPFDAYCHYTRLYYMPNFMQLQVVKIDLQMILCLKNMIYQKDGDKGCRNDSLFGYSVL